MLTTTAMLLLGGSHHCWRRYTRRRLSDQAGDVMLALGATASLAYSQQPEAP